MSPPNATKFFQRSQSVDASIFCCFKISDPSMLHVFVSFGKHSFKSVNSLMENKFVEYRKMLIHLIQERNSVTDVTSTRNPLKINVRTQYMAASRLPTAKTNTSIASNLKAKCFLPKTCTLADTKKQNDEAQSEVI